MTMPRTLSSISSPRNSAPTNTLLSLQRSCVPTGRLGGALSLRRTTLPRGACPLRVPWFTRPRGIIGCTVLAFALLVLGCPGVTVKPLPSDPVEEKKVKGIRYLRDAPFLLVYSDGKGGLLSEVLFLPDTTQRMSARPYAILASNEAAFKFANGVLTGQEIKVDETIVPTAVLSSLETVASAALKAFNTAGASADAALPAPSLFRIVVRGNRLGLAGPALLPDGRPLPPIADTISAPQEKEK
jgi:hypothetical protein